MWSAVRSICRYIDRSCTSTLPYRIHPYRLTPSCRDLQRRGCVRTAFEFARLLFSLDPLTDPHGALLHLDYLALKAGMGQWLLDVWNHYDENLDKAPLGYGMRVDVTSLPGWAYARALALRTIKGQVSCLWGHVRLKLICVQDHKRSQEALINAIRNFPSVVPLLADKLELPLTSAIMGRKEVAIRTDARWVLNGLFPNAYLIGLDCSSLTDVETFGHLLSHLYVQRSFSLWKSPDVSSWFAGAVAAAFSSAQQPEQHLLHDCYGLFSDSVWRHVMILEPSYRNLYSFLPKRVLNARSLACDPLPPLTAVSAYDQEFFKGTEDMFAARTRQRTRGGEAADQRMLERLIPDEVFRGQLQVRFSCPDYVFVTE